MQPPQPKEDDLTESKDAFKNEILEQVNDVFTREYKKEYIIDWKLHSIWVLAIVCFILARLWWLVPLPGADPLPAYRTYPANFLNTLFLTLGCALATRSLTVALVKSFEKGVAADSVLAYGETGGVGAMWSCIRKRSGFRYFCAASLVTAAIMLGNLLEGELQSSLTVHYKKGMATDMNLAECRHTNVSDFEAASLAYQQDHITHTLSDTERLLNKSHQYDYFGVSVIQTTLTPIEDITMNNADAEANNGLIKRHWHRTTTTTICTEVHTTATTAATTTTTTSTTSSTLVAIPGDDSIASIVPTHTPGQQQQQQQQQDQQKNRNNMMILSLYGEQILINNTATSEAGGSNLTSSNLIVYKSTGSDGILKALPYQNQHQQLSNATVQLSAIRHTTPDGKEAILVYPATAADASLAAGVFISAVATNYTCQPLTGCVATSAEPVAVNNKVVADALLAAMQSGTGLYGTSSFDALTLAIVNQDPRLGSQGALADALFNNPNCPESELLPSQGFALLPYTAAHWTILSIIWIALFAILWAIGAYLIGKSVVTWGQLTRTGRMISLTIHNSPQTLFTENGKLANDRRVYLKLEKASFGYHVVEDLSDPNEQSSYRYETSRIDLEEQ
jgi:hypothetical protein